MLAGLGGARGTAAVPAVPPVVPQVMLVVPDEARAGAGEVGEEELPGSPDLLRGRLAAEGDCMKQG